MPAFLKRSFVHSSSITNLFKWVAICSIKENAVKYLQIFEFMWIRSIEPNKDPIEAILTGIARYNPLQ